MCYHMILWLVQVHLTSLLRHFFLSSLGPSNCWVHIVLTNLIEKRNSVQHKTVQVRGSLALG